jgi:putative endonuclease
MMKRKNTGILGEKLAQDFLKRKGYNILETNFRCRKDEIDIIALHKDSLVFIEVRTKSNLDFGTPEESITPNKMEHLERAANYYRQNHDELPASWRIDVVAIELDAKNTLKRIELIENAIEG